MINITTKTGKTPYFKIGSVLRFRDLWGDGTSATGHIDLDSYEGDLTLTDHVTGMDIRIAFVFTGDRELTTQQEVLNADIMVTDIY